METTTPTTELNVVVVDDHPIFREGLVRLIDTRFDTSLQEAGDMPALEALLTSSAAPDLLVLDVIFPGFDVREHLPMLRSRLVTTAIIVVSMVEDEDLIDTIMADGANGFVSKSAAPNDMMEAFSKILEGSTEVIRPVRTSQVTTAKADTPLSRLSPRQTQVLALICDGQSNKEIAKNLQLSPFTVRIHVSALLRTLEVPTRAAAAAVAARGGLNQ